MTLAARLYFMGVPPGVFDGLKLVQMAELDKFIIAREMGWTLDYIDTLTPEQRGALKAFLNEYRKNTGGLM